MRKNRGGTFMRNKVMSAAALFAAVIMAVVTVVSGKDLVTVNAAANEEFTRTAIEITEDMGNGWNLGNTMEAINTWTANPTVKDFETAWGQPVTTQAMITGIKNAGFDSIRIPVSWSNMISSDGTYTIDSALFDRVDEIIEYALNNDMYVIVNIHWDNGWWDQFETDESGAMARYKAMWTQIAEHYKDYSEKLVFESANEELVFSYTLVNQINQEFVNLVRASGGNNDRRYLLIAGYNTDIDKTCSTEFVMPTDTIDNHLMVSVHYYTPWIYVGLYEDEGYGYQESWGDASDKAAMKTNLEKLKKFTEAGYGVIIGEYSVLPQYVSDGNYNRKAGDTEFISYLLELCDEYGFAPYLWDAGDWYDRAGCTMRWSDMAALFLKEDTIDTPDEADTPATGEAIPEVWGIVLLMSGIVIVCMSKKKKTAQTQ